MHINECYITLLSNLTLYFELSVAQSEDGILILKAEYGDLPNGARVDVTEKVTRHCTPAGLQVET